MGTKRSEQPLKRRRHAPEFKAMVVAECSGPGVSTAAIALRHGLNANLLRRWVNEGMGEKSGHTDPLPEDEVAQVEEPVVSRKGFIPVRLEVREPSAQSLEIDISRGSVLVKVRWPISISRECGAWLRELLR